MLLRQGVFLAAQRWCTRLPTELTLPCESLYGDGLLKVLNKGDESERSNHRELRLQPNHFGLCNQSLGTKVTTRRLDSGQLSLYIVTLGRTSRGIMDPSVGRKGALGVEYTH